jgi:DNA-binding MltR family transcriptional regulator
VTARWDKQYQTRVGTRLTGLPKVHPGTIVVPMYSPQEHERIVGELRKQTDRGAAMIGSAYVEDALQKILLASFHDKSPTVVPILFEGPNGPLSSFSAKIRIAYAFGLIGEHTQGDLDQIRDIRNRFAHEFLSELRFATDQSIGDKCRSLWWPQNVYSWAKESKAPTEFLPFRSGRTPRSPKSLYVAAVIIIAGFLTTHHFSFLLADDYKGLIERQPKRAPLLP